MFYLQKRHSREVYESERERDKSNYSTALSLVSKRTSPIILHFREQIFTCLDTKGTSYYLFSRLIRVLIREDWEQFTRLSSDKLYLNSLIKPRYPRKCLGPGFLDLLAFRS
uniref:Uncharacterized protein n=1 Tax=Cacopsylla melanoneura TaxID=428564 RepID=A0A8D9BP65_9HEMI